MERVKLSTQQASEVVGAGLATNLNNQPITSLQNSPVQEIPFPLKIAHELLAAYGSPLYVYQGDRLRQTIGHITQAIPYPRTHFHFASVTNGNVALLQIFQAQGWGLHANTPGDIYLGLQAGFDSSQILYSGSNLNRAEMEQVLNWGVTTLNLDSLAQLRLCCEVYQSLQASVKAPLDLTPPMPPVPCKGTGELNSPLLTPLKKGGRGDREGLGERLTEEYCLHLGLRLNLPELTGDSRIGVRPTEFPEAISLTGQAGLKLSGLHFYRGTGTNATKAFTQVIDTVLATAQLLPDWEYLDFGGGFGYPYHSGGAAFDWEMFGVELTQRLSRLGRDINLVIEPGRAVIAGCATLLAQVVSVKWQDEKQILGVDTTVANLSVPSVHGGYREIVTWVGAQGDAPLHPTDVCGNTTYSRDYLGKNCLLPALEIGDIIAILDVGAYGYAMSSHFLHRPRPAEVLLEADKHRLIRKREDYSILLKNQVFN